MKKSFLVLVVFVLSVLLIPFTSCKDEFTDKDALMLEHELADSLIRLQDALQRQRDSLLRIGGIIHYSITVVPVGGSAFPKSSGPQKASPLGAVVTVAQNGYVVSDTVGASGIAVFDDMRIGNVSVTVNLPGHTSIMYIADLTPAGGYTETGGVSGDAEGATGIDLSHIVRYAATMAPMFPISGNDMATIEGRATIQTNLTNKVTEIPAGARVTALLDVTNPSFASFWESLGYSYNIDGAGKIVKLVFTDAVYSTTVAGDGTYTLQVPGSGQPGVPIKLEISDYQADQTLLMNTLNGEQVFGLQTVPTLWGELVAPSAVPSVPAAYTLVADPVGAVAMVSTTAVAVAHIDITNAIISSVNITNPGTGYYLPGTGYYTAAFTQDGSDNGGSARFYIEAGTGRVTHAVVTSTGSNYTTSAQINITRVGTPFEAQLQVTGTTITGVTISNQGNYRVDPTNTQIRISGTNVTGVYLQPNWFWNGNGWSVSSVTILNDNAGTFTNNAPVTIAATAGTDATYNINFRTGFLASISITNPGAGYYSTPDVIITGGGGSGARATAHVDVNTHRVDYITIDDPGSGYTTSPSIILQVRDLRTKGKINLNVNTAGVITGATIADAGQGYYNVPDITVVPSIAGMGSGAVVRALIDQNAGIISGAVVINGGTGYLGVNYPATAQAPSFPSTVNAISGKTYILNIDFGTGKRSIEN